MKTSLLLLFISVLFLGCAGVGKLNTLSGKPEIVIINGDREKIRTAFIEFIPNLGQTVKKVDSTVVLTYGSVEVPTSYLGASTSIGANSTYNIVKSGNNIKIFALRFVNATRDMYGYWQPPILTSAVSNEYNSQTAYEEMQRELEKFLEFYNTNYK